jgi:hypothetical protein
MKTLKPIITSMLSCLLISSLLILSGCKKEKKTQPETFNTILGGWYETPITVSISRNLNFGSDGTFIMTIANYGTPTSVIKFSGTFKIKGDSLLVTIKEKSIREGNNPATTTPANDKLYESAKFNVNDSILTLNYTTYPADAPVSTQAKFRRQLPD